MPADSPPTANRLPKSSFDDHRLTALDRGLCALQTAVRSSALYDVAHPLVTAAEAEAQSQLQAAIGDSETLTVARLGDRIVSEGRRLPSERVLRKGLFSLLDSHGLDAFVFDRALDAESLAELLTALRSPKSRPPSSDDPEAKSGPPAEPFGSHLADCSARMIRLNSGERSLRLELRDGPLEGDGERVGNAVSGPGAAGSGAASSARAGAGTGAEAEAGAGAGAAAEAGTESPDHLVEPTGDALSGIISGEGVSGDVLANLAEQLGRAAEVGSGALVPMSSLRRHDAYTFVHAVNVGILSGGLARAANLSESITRDITLAGLLHDTGKEAIAVSLLNSPNKLSPMERAEIESHPAMGARLLLKAKKVPQLAVIVAHEHHMNADGTGYPKMPTGHKRHPASQIVQLADVFDALRTHRPYRKALPLAKVHEILLAGRGTHYDSDLLDLFLTEVVHDAFATAEEPPLAAAA